MPKTRKAFVDFRAIRARITMEDVLKHYGLLDNLKRTGNRLSGPCPIHNGSNPSQFRVETEKNIWNCFGDCKCGGNSLDFIAKMEHVSIHAAALKACEWFNIPLPEKTKTGSGSKSEQSPTTPEETGTTKPVEAASENSGSSDTEPNPPLKFQLEKLDRSHPYFAQRGISQETVIDFGLGFFSGDRGLMVGRIVIPIHNVKGELLAYAGRWPGETPDRDSPKYKLPPGFKKSLELFNLDRAIKEPEDQPLVIVEGFFDAIRLHEHGCKKVVALMGSDLSAAQERLLRDHLSQRSRVLVMLDEDEAGRAARQDIASRLAQFCFVKVHEFDQPGAQPEHLSREDVQQLIGGTP